MLNEITIVCYAVLVGINAVQVAVISGPRWLNIVLIGLSAGLAAFVNRSQVTPVAKAKLKPPPAA